MPANPESYLERQKRLQPVQNTYQELLGREGSPDEWNAHTGNPNFFADIYGSEEASNRRNGGAGPVGPAPPDGGPAQAQDDGNVGQPVRSLGPPHMATAATASRASAPPPPPPSASRQAVAKPTGVGKVVVEPTSTYTAGTLQAKTAGPGFSQFTNPNAGQVPQLNQDLITNILQNPETMSPDMVNQLKARGKDAALNMASQLRDGAHADTASRGFSNAGGMQAGYDRQIDSQLIGDILDTNRDIDITAAQTNRADQLAANAAGTGWENALAERASNNYRSRLLGESTASDDVYRNNALDLDRFKTTEGTRQAEDASRFRNESFRYDQMRDDRNQTLQEFLGQEGVNLDWARLDQQDNQFNRTMGENSRQHNNSLGFNYASLSASQQARLMDQINALLPQ